MRIHLDPVRFFYHLCLLAQGFPLHQQIGRRHLRDPGEAPPPAGPDDVVVEVHVAFLPRDVNVGLFKDDRLFVFVEASGLDDLVVLAPVENERDLAQAVLAKPETVVDQTVGGGSDVYNAEAKLSEEHSIYKLVKLFNLQSSHARI